MPNSFRIPRSRTSETHHALRDQMLAAIEPLVLNTYSHSAKVRTELENAFAAEMDAKYAVAVGSGTVALFLALRACGISAGDEVITVANSDISTTAAISNCGARPVVADVLASDYTIDPDLVAALITPNTRAILPVDLHGHPANVKQLRQLADQHNLKIVEDAALATGAHDFGCPVGAFADVAVFSLAPFKPFGSAGNGGIVVTDDADIYQNLCLLADYGHAPRSPDQPAAYQNYIAEGYNVPLDALQAAILLIKLPYLKQWTARRRAIGEALEAGLAGTSARTPVLRPESAPTFRSYTICVGRQLEVHQALRAAGIEAVIHYAPPITHYTVYDGLFPNKDQLPVTERLGREIVNLPVSPEFTDDDIDFMIDTTRHVLQAYD